MKDTIVALSTPLGRSGIGVIRLSGENALQITHQLIHDSNFTLQPRQAYLRKIFDPNNELIDTALITYFKAPHSFTGEDVVEISCHGSPVLLRQIIDLALRFNARLAEPGEFTLRALSSGQINLSQAEAIRDLIDAQTTSAVRQAARQLGGELSNQLQPLKDQLLNNIVIMESALEFVEDDLPEVATENIKQSLKSIHDELGKLADTYQAGRLIREGLKVALVGRPNVGKSSLFNALLGQDRAIVTEIAGTTRDSLHEKISIRGIPVSLIDTAGLREATDTVESIGVARTKRAIADADLVIVILDGSENFTDEDLDVITQTEQYKPLTVVNKTDLHFDKTKITQFLKSKIANQSPQIIFVSAKTGEGLDELLNAIILPFAPHEIETQGFLLTDARHYDLLVRSQTEIVSSLFLLDEKVSEEMILVGLHNALKLLGEITGETTTEDMLTQIFSTFCVGK
jgi:tRNA modification GTPase